MTNEPLNQQILRKIATMRFNTIVAETNDNQPLTLSLPVDAGVQGFIVLLQPALPLIV